MIKFQILEVNVKSTMDALVNNDKPTVLKIKNPDNYYEEADLKEAIRCGDYKDKIKLGEDMTIINLTVKKIVKQRKGYNWCTSSYMRTYTPDGKLI